MPTDLWLAWAGVALVGALLALDDTAVAQLWFSQPLPAALLVGLVVGDPAAALVPGTFMQLMVLGNLPVGAATTLDHTSATVGMVGGALMAGFRLPESVSLLSAWTPLVGAQVGLMLVLMAVISHLAGSLVELERRNHLVWKLASYRRIRDGEFDVVAGLQRRAIGVTMARGGAVSLLVAVLVSMVWAPLVGAIPERGMRILALAPYLAIALAVGALVERHGRHPAWRWVLAPALVGAVVVWRLS